MKKVIFIGGPTASGKTALAIHLANALQTEIISADSRQIFKGMEIGTAQPTPDELSQAKHHLIGTLNPNEPFSAGDFEKQALELCTTLFHKSDYVICVGGTGLYMKALYDGIDDFPEIPLEIRNQLNKELESTGLTFLQHELKQKDLTYYSQVDIDNPQRVIRALEIIRHTNTPYSTFLTAQKVERPFESIKLAIHHERPKLYERINKRTEVMLNEGWEKEVENLSPYFDCNALRTVGYKEIIAHQKGEINRAEMVETIQRQTRRYAKRQVTWFKKEKFEWIEPQDFSSLLEKIKS